MPRTSVQQATRAEITVRGDLWDHGPHKGEPNGDFTIVRVNDPLQHLPLHLAPGYGLSAGGVIEIENTYGCVIETTP